MRRSSSSRSDLNSLPDTPESPKRLPEDPEPPSSGVGVPPEQLHGGAGAVVHGGTQRTGRVSTGRSGTSKRVLRAALRGSNGGGLLAVARLRFEAWRRSSRIVVGTAPPPGEDEVAQLQASLQAVPAGLPAQLATQPLYVSQSVATEGSV